MRKLQYSTPVRFGGYSLIISLIGMMTIALLTYQSSAELLQEQALKSVNNELQREESLFMEKIRTLKDDMQLLSNNSAVQGIIRARQGDGYDEAENMTLEMWQQRLASTASTVLQQRGAYQIAQLIALEDDTPLLNLERQDNIILNLQEKASDADSLNQAYQDVKTTLFSKMYINGPMLLKKDRQVMYPPQSALFASRLIRDNYGQPYAMLIIQINFDHMIRNLRATKNEVSFFVASESGQYIAHPDSTRNWSYGLTENSSLTLDYPMLGDISYQEGEFFDNHTLSTSTDDNGVVLRHLPLRSEGFGMNLLIGAETNLSYLHQESQGLFRNILILMAIGVLVIAFATTLAAYYLTRPLLRLKSATDKITEGQSELIPVDGHDEIASLGRSIKAMLEHLDHSREELADINASLEQKVSDRTLELEIALDQANAAAVAKAQFLATMSHEIRTPLNGVLGMTELLMNTSLDHQQRRHVETVKRSGVTLLNLLNDILDLSKIEAGKLTINHSEFNPNELIENCVLLFSDTASKKGLEVIPVTLPSLPNMLMGDPDRISQILMNLTNNAVKFTDHGEIVVSIRIIEDRESQMILRFIVEDTGIGISDEAQKRLFQKFVQLDSSSTRKYGGTGLGLAISRQLTELMGGHISLESHEGKGTKIWFDLPFEKGQRQIGPTIEHQQLLEDMPVLIVDDNATNRELLEHITQSWGMINDSANSAVAAFNLINRRHQENKPYQMILIDQMMPDVTGLELAERIRKHPQFGQLHIIMLSSMEIGTEQEWLDRGISFYLRKPFRQSELYNAIIHSLLGDRNPAISSASALPSSTPAGKERNRQATPGSGSSLQDRKHCHVLLVEDTPVNQQVSLGLLGQEGINADLAENGVEALELWQKKQYDLILMDIQMPEMDGFEATQKIRESESGNTRIPIVALTAHAMSGDKERCLAHGMDDHLAKPLTRQALVDCLLKWLPASTDIPAHFIPDASTYPLLEDRTLPDLAIPDTASDAAEEGQNNPDNTDNPMSQPVLDQDTLGKLYEDLGCQSLTPLLTTFSDSLPELAESIKSAAREENYEQLRKAAHRLKGSARSLGAWQTGALAEKLEEEARVNEFDKLSKTMEQLDPAIIALEKALQDKSIDVYCHE